MEIILFLFQSINLTIMTKMIANESLWLSISRKTTKFKNEGITGCKVFDEHVLTSLCSETVVS